MLSFESRRYGTFKSAGKVSSDISDADLLALFYARDLGGVVVDSVKRYASTSATMAVTGKGVVAEGVSFTAANSDILNWTSGQFSVATWVRVKALPGSGQYITLLGRVVYNNESNSQGWIMQFNASNDAKANKFVFHVRGNNSSSQSVASTSAPTVGQDYFVVFTGDGTTRRLYINGVLNASDSSGVQTPITTSTTLEMAGAAGFVQTYSAAMFRRALNAGEISQMYARGPHALTAQQQRPVIPWFSTITKSTTIPSTARIGGTNTASILSGARIWSEPSITWGLSDRFKASGKPSSIPSRMTHSSAYGLVACYDMLAGGLLLDSARFNGVAAVTGGSWIKTFPHGNAFRSTSSDGISIADNPNIRFGGSFSGQTIVRWQTQLTSTGQTSGIITKGGDSFLQPAPFGLCRHVTSGTQFLYFVLSANNSSIRNQFAAIGAPLVNTWYNVVWVYDSVSGTATVCCNGQIATLASSVGFSPVDAGGAVTVGFPGTADDEIALFRLWNRALTLPEALQLSTRPYILYEHRPFSYVVGVSSTSNPNFFGWSGVPVLL